MGRILQIIFLILIAATILICISKPDMHKTLIVYDSAYTLVPENQTQIEKDTIPIMQKKAEPVKTERKLETVVTKEIKQNPKIETKTRISSATQVQEKAINTTKKQTSTPKTNSAIKKEVVQTKTISTDTTFSPKTTTAQKVLPKVNTLTQQEEIIAWNIWRSNLQNKIMQDTKLPILPTGVVFKFSFIVDKYGKISNLQTWSETPTYTPYAIQYIAPVIRSYQGRSILNFPEGTARTFTEVKGGWRISANEKYSTPNDYNDIEKIIKQ